MTLVTKKCSVLMEGRETWDENGIVEQSLEFAVPQSVGSEGLKVSIRANPTGTDISVWNPFTQKWIPFLKLVSH